MITFCYRRDRSARTCVAESLSSIMDYLPAQYPLSKMLPPYPTAILLRRFIVVRFFLNLRNGFRHDLSPTARLSDDVNSVANVKLLH